MHWAVLFTYMVSFIGYMVTGWGPILLVLLLGTFIRTVGGGTIWVYSSSLLQMIVPDKYLGRVFAFDIAMMTLASSISTLWVGWARDSLGFSPYQVWLVQGVIPLVAMIGWLIYVNLRFKRQPVPSTPPI